MCSRGCRALHRGLIGGRVCSGHARLLQQALLQDCAQPCVKRRELTMVRAHATCILESLDRFGQPLLIYESSGLSMRRLATRSTPACAAALFESSARTLRYDSSAFDSGGSMSRSCAYACCASLRLVAMTR